MADIRISALPLATGGASPAPTDVIALDGTTTRKAPLSALADVINAPASQAEAEAGINAVKRMTPLTTSQAIASNVGVTVQGYSSNLDSFSAISPGAAGSSIISSASQSDARSNLLLDKSPNIQWFGAVGDNSTNNSSAFTAADTAFPNTPILVPAGTYVTSYVPVGLYYGPGSIKIGSENVILDRRIAQKVNTDPPGGGDEDDESDVPERRQNWVAGQGAGLGLTASADANTIAGYKAALGQTSQSRLTAFGYLAGGTANGYADTIVGASAASQTAFRERNVIMGATAGKWLGTNDPVGTDHDLWVAPDETYFGLATRNPTFWAGLTVSGIARGTPLAATLPTANTDAARNVILGRDCLNHAPKAFGNFAGGYRAARFFYNASDCVAIGYETMGDGLFAFRNNAIGSTAMNYCQSGQYNDALGYAAMKNNVFADFNTAIGAFSMLNMGVGFTSSATAKAEIEGNVAIGKDSLRFATEGQYNTAVGMQSMGVGTSTGNRNTAMGFFSLSANTTGGNNVAVGQRAAYPNLTGSNIVALGGQAMEVMQDGTAMTALSNVIGIGFQAAVSAANQAQIGNSSVTTYVYGTVQTRSDERDKAEIRDTSLGLEFINHLRPVDYKWNYREDYIERDENGEVTGRLENDGSKTRKRFHHGFIAQDIKTLIDDGVIPDFGGFQDHKVSGGADVYSLGATELLAPLVKAVQELSKRLEELEK